MKRAILIAAVEPAIGGVLVFGDRGTGKSTAVRGLAALLPPMAAVHGCRYGCAPASRCDCDACREILAGTRPSRVRRVPVPVVDLPLGASEDRVVGALDLEQALDARRATLRAWPARAGASRLPLHRRGQPAGRPPRGSADRRGRVGRERRRAGGPQRAASGALRADRQRQSGGGRTASAVARSLRAVGRSADVGGHRRARAGDQAPRRVRARPARFRASLGERRMRASVGACSRRVRGSPRRRCRTRPWKAPRACA